MNITLMNTIDTEQFSELFFRKNHSIARKKNWWLRTLFFYPKNLTNTRFDLILPQSSSLLIFQMNYSLVRRIRQFLYLYLLYKFDGNLPGSIGSVGGSIGLWSSILIASSKSSKMITSFDLRRIARFAFG